MFFAFATLDAPKSASPRTASFGRDHRHVNAYLSEPRVRENDVKAGTFVRGVPMRDFLLLFRGSADVLEPVV